MILPDGTVRWQQWTNPAIVDDQGGSRISPANREQERAIRRSEAQFRAIFEHMGTATVIFDSEG